MPTNFALSPSERPINITFCFYFLSGHVVAFCDELDKRPDVNFSFVSVCGPQGLKKDLGDFSDRPYLIRPYLNDSELTKAKLAIKKADILISYCCDLTKTCLSEFNGNLFLMSENFLRKKTDFFNPLTIARAVHIRYLIRPFVKHNASLLCSGFSSCLDFGKIGLFKGKMHKWGYFVQDRYFCEENRSYFSDGKIRFLWSGRFIKWKHPEIPFLVADVLDRFEPSLDYEITLTTTTCDELTRFLKKIGWPKKYPKIKVKGFLKPDELILEMHKSDVYLFPSDCGEGWGVVLSEAMASGCCPIANVAAGASGYLIKDGANGFGYSSRSEFIDVIKSIAKDKFQIVKMGKNARKFLKECYCSRVAADNLLAFAKNKLVKDATSPEPFSAADKNSKGIWLPN